MKKYVLLFGLLVFGLGESWGQNAILGTGFAGGWSGTNEADWRFFAPSAGTSRILIGQSSETGDRFFRFVRGWGDGDFRRTQFRPTSGVNTLQGIGISTTPLAGDNGAFFIPVGSTDYRYIFKTRTPDGTPEFVVFEVQGAIQTVSSVDRQLDAIAPAPGQSITVTATLSADFPAGQSAYIRFTTDNFNTSTVVEMTGSGTTRTAVIPATVNTPGTTVRYYTFTSGNGLSITGADADFFTINLNNNGGSNFSYTVANSWITTGTETSNWDNPATWLVGEVPPANQPVTIAKNVNLTDSRSIQNLTINSGATLNCNGNNLTINGAVTNNGTLDGGSGTVAFAAGSSISGTGIETFNNVQNSALNLDLENSVLNGTLRLLFGSSISAGPTYGPESTLIYDTGGPYTRTSEWGMGENESPFNVTLGTTTNFTLGANRRLNGTFTITGGSTLIIGTNTLTLGDGASVINNGNISGASSTVVLLGTASFSGTPGVTQFNNLTLSPTNTTEYNLTGRTIGGTLTVNANATVTGAPSYAANSTLRLNMGGNFTTSDEILPIGNLPRILNIDGNTNVSLHFPRSIREILIGSGSTFNLNGNNLTINNAGNLTNNGTFTVGSGKVVFAGSATLSGTLNFQDVDISGGVNFGTGSTINGNLRILAGGFFQTNQPNFAANSVLSFETNGPYNLTADLLPTGTGDNRPFNIDIVNSNVTLTVSGRTVRNNFTVQSTGMFNQGDNALSVTNNLEVIGTYRTGTGALTARTITVDEGGTFEQGTVATVPFVNHAPVTVIESLTIIGTYNILDSTNAALIVREDINLNAPGTLSLSNRIGGDLRLQGNWNRTAGSTFTPNNRAVFFEGNNSQSINFGDGTGTENWAFIRFSKPENTTVTLNTNITCTSTTLESFAIENTSGNSTEPFTLNLNGRTLSFTGNGGTFVSNGNTLINGGMLLIGGNKALNNDSQANFRLGGDATLQIADGFTFDLTSRSLEIEGSLVTDGTGGLIAGPESNLIITGTGNVGAFNVLPVEGVRALGSLTVNRIGTHTFGGFDVRGNLTIGANVIINNGDPIVMNNPSGNQDLVGTGSIARLTVNKTAGDVVLTENSQINLTGTLTVTRGNIVTQNNAQIILSPTATLSEADGFILGRVTTTREFGTASNSFGGMGISIASASDLGNTTVTRVTGQQLVGQGGASLRRFFTIVPANNENLDATVTYTYRAEDLPTGFDVATMELFKRPSSSNEPDDWAKIDFVDAVRDADLNTVTVAQVPNFSTIIGASPNFSSNSLLPVELISFTGSKRNQVVSLEWITASEINNYGFEVERSLDGERFEFLGFVRGNGTTSALNRYTFVDESLKTNEGFYRLRQVDYDGSYEYSPVIMVRSFGDAPQFNVADRPGHWMLEIAKAEREIINLTLYDVSGKPLQKFTVNHGGGTEYHKLMKPANNGMYLIELQGKWGREVRKVAF